VTVVPAVVAVVVSVASLAWLLAALARRRRSEAAPGARPTRATTWEPTSTVARSCRRPSPPAPSPSSAASARDCSAPPRRLASRAGITIPQAASPAGPIPAGTELSVKGITPYLTDNSDFYRIDTALTPPDVPADNWSLRIHGEVDNELELSFADLLSRRLVERRITLTCVSNEVGGELAGNATWTGVLLKDLLEEAGVRTVQMPSCPPAPTTSPPVRRWQRSSTVAVPWLRSG
jgi:DMSO/TMAO reductase YedYZ molybdopterin-dependent catalytic subunit